MTSKEFLRELSQSQIQQMFLEIYKSLVGIKIVKHHTHELEQGGKVDAEIYSGTLCRFYDPDVVVVLTAGHVVCSLRNQANCCEGPVELSILDRGACGGGNEGVPIRTDVCLTATTWKQDGDPDHGCVAVPRFEANAILAGNRCAQVTDLTIAGEADDFDAYFLIGYPKSVRQGQVVQPLMSKMQLQDFLKCPLVPITRQEASNGRFVGKIDTIDNPLIRSVDGMSGGPVWGVKHRGEYLDIRLVAIQSTQGNQSGNIYAESAPKLFDMFKSSLSEFLMGNE